MDQFVLKAFKNVMLCNSTIAVTTIIGTICFAGIQISLCLINPGLVQVRLLSGQNLFLSFTKVWSNMSNA